MGTIHKTTQQQDELQFYTTIQTEQHNKCDVFSSNKFPGCYVIKVVTPLLETSKLELFAKIENHQNIYLLSLYGYRIGLNCHCQVNNITSESVISFWQYLAYSLRDIIRARQKASRSFQQTEIWHVIKAAYTGYATFQQLQICYEFQPSKIMVNQEGRARLSWQHIQHRNSHSLFFRKLHKGTMLLADQQYLSPEQLAAIQIKQFTAKISFQKANMFSLGMVLLQCMSLLNPIVNCYKHFQVNYEAIEQIMSFPRLQTLYSQHLLKLVGKMLRLSPIQRPSFHEVSSEHSQLMNRDYCIAIKEPQKNNFNQNSKNILYSHDFEGLSKHESLEHHRHRYREY